jgi:hypothetical protein
VIDHREGSALIPRQTRNEDSDRSAKGRIQGDLRGLPSIAANQKNHHNLNLLGIRFEVAQSSLSPPGGQPTEVRKSAKTSVRTIIAKSCSQLAWGNVTLVACQCRPRRARKRNPYRVVSMGYLYAAIIGVLNRLLR